jgi:hypothetical protein
MEYSLPHQHDSDGGRDSGVLPRQSPQTTAELIGNSDR